MIIFDLDGTLADCEHRRHFVDPYFSATSTQPKGWYYKDRFEMSESSKLMKFIPDWKEFYEACDKDEIILPVAFQFYALRDKFGICHPIQIWSGRCESVKGKTIDWLQKYFTRDIDWLNNLKMRPIGDSTPDDVLKEKWLDEAIAQGIDIEYVFDNQPNVVRMWKRRGIFVFDVNQSRVEF